jgi:hypothetical protein
VLSLRLGDFPSLLGCFCCCDGSDCEGGDALAIRVGLSSIAATTTSRFFIMAAMLAAALASVDSGFDDNVVEALRCSMSFWVLLGGECAPVDDFDNFVLASAWLPRLGLFRLG